MVFLLAVVLALGSTSSALGQTGMFHDARRDVRESSGGRTTAGIDIHRVEVRHMQHRVVTITRVANLTRSNSRDYFDVAFNVSASNAGPEFCFDRTGKHRGLYRTRTWSAGTWERVPCRDLDLRADLSSDTLRLVVPRSCLGHPKRVGVSVFIGYARGDGTFLDDYAPRRHAFTRLVSAG